MTNSVRLSIKHFNLNSNNSWLKHNLRSLFLSRLLAPKTTEQVFFALLRQLCKGLILEHLFLVKHLVSRWKTILCSSPLTPCISPFPVLPFLLKSCHFVFRWFKNHTLFSLPCQNGETFNNMFDCDKMNKPSWQKDSSWQTFSQPLLQSPECAPVLLHRLGYLEWTLGWNPWSMMSKELQQIPFVLCVYWMNRMWKKKSTEGKKKPPQWKIHFIP